ATPIEAIMTTQQSSSMKTSNSQQTGCLDPLDALIDFSGYEQVSYSSPSISPSATKSEFLTKPVSNTPPTMPPSQPSLSGPSHNYDLYRQQTGIPQGAVANTLAVNSSNAHINSQYGYSDGYLSGLSPNDEFVDFNTAPARNGSFNPSDIDMEFDSPNPEPAFFYPEQSSNEFVDPSAIGASHDGLPVSSGPTTHTSNVGRLWPGMHQQQALAKAQAQQKQQQQIIQQQRQNAMAGQARQSSQRPRASHPPTDPIVEEKISQLLNSMRQNSVGTEDNNSHSPDNMSHAHRMRKDEEEMDEDERLLASEEGKKLSSKERRQLRNKVSARAFRSRRKEYIGQLEGEIAGKVNENQDLRSTNRALMEENTRLSDLTRMLLSSPSFSGFLDTLSQNPAAAQTAQQVTQPRVEQQQQQQAPQRQVRKDVNPYAAQQMQQQQQHIGMTMIPEQNMDFSMLDLTSDGSFSYQPQVFSCLSLPETTIDTEVLSGKATNSFTASASDDEKVELPTIERVPESTAEEAPANVVEVVDEEFDSDPTFALFTSSASATPVTTASEPQELSFDVSTIDMTAKPSTYELVVSSASDDACMRKVERLAAEMDAVAERLANLTVNL
ncbi:BZIP-type transcription factor, partial [Lachnellula occidentalis]